MAFDKLFRERIVIEGNSPERALARLQKAGICLFRIKKIKKNQILLTVTKKDSEKVFAIYPNICYNREDKKAYTAKRAGRIGLYRAVTLAQKRWGAILGAAIFLFLTAVADRFVFRISLVGETSYLRETEEVLASFGVKRYSFYPDGREERIAAELLKLDGVSFASVQKSGVTVRVELQTSPFGENALTFGDMTAMHTGVLLSATVLRGTLLKKVGEQVYTGEPIVGGYFLTETGERTEVYPIARVTLLCTFEEYYEGVTAEEATGKALLFADGVVREKTATEKDGGYLVTVVYEATESINF